MLKRIIVIVIIGLTILAALLIYVNRVRIADDNCRSGIVCMKKQQYEEAIAFFDKAVAVMPNCKQAYANMGLSYEAMGKTKEALTCYKKTLKCR